jgi:hypothetical protein
LKVSVLRLRRNGLLLWRSAGAYDSLISPLVRGMRNSIVIA